MAFRYKFLLAVLVLGVFGVSWATLGNPAFWLVLPEKYKSQASIELRGPAQLPMRDLEPAPETRTLRVAVAPIVSVERAFSNYEPLADYLGRCLGMEGKIIYRRSYAEVNEMVRLGNCDLAFVCTFPFVLGRRDFGMRALVVPQGEQGPRYRSLILVPQGSGAASLEDLRGKRFAFSDEYSTGGWLYPATYLKKRGHRPAEFFSARIRTGSHDRAVDAVVAGLADGAAVDDFVFEAMAARDPRLRSSLRVIQSSGYFGAPPVVVPKQMKPGLEKRMKACLLSLHENEEGRRILRGLGAQRYLPPSPGLYQGVESLEAYLGAGR